jgi:hypothetical protein
MTFLKNFEFISTNFLDIFMTQKSFKKNTYFSIVLLLSCILISLSFSNIPFIIKYFRNNNRFRRIEGMTNFDDIKSSDDLDTLQSTMDDISSNVDKMNTFIQSNISSTSEKDNISDNENFNKNIKKHINLINTGINNIDIPDIQSDLSDIVTKHTPSNKEKSPSDYQDLVDNLKNEIKNINQKISDKRQILANQAVSDTKKSVSGSKNKENDISNKNPLHTK